MSAVTGEASLRKEPPEDHVATSAVLADRIVLSAEVAIFVFGVALILGLLAYYLLRSSQSLYFTPYSLLEESAYTFLSANNYLRFGFLNSGLLQDFATSPFAADHPFVYNHMPPGPDLVTALLLRLTSGNYALVRAIFTGSAIAGIVVYFIFGRALLRSLGGRFCSTLLVLITPWTIVRLFDRQVYSPVVLFIFLPLLLVLISLRNGKRSYFFCALPLIAIFSFYIEYSTLAAVIFCWGMLFVTQLMPLKVRHMVVIGAAFAIGIGAHLLQNMLYLGWDTFWLELKLAISNRMAGIPTQQELAEFYRKIGIVHHGSRSIELSSIVAQVRANFEFPARQSAVLLFVAWLLWEFSGRFVRFRSDDGAPAIFSAQAKREIGPMARLIVWGTVTVLAPIILFPAFAQEVNLRGSGINLFFLAIPLSYLIGESIWLLAYGAHRAKGILSDPENAIGRAPADLGAPGPAVAKYLVVVFRTFALAVICVSLIAGSFRTLAYARSELSQIILLGSDPEEWKPLYEISRFDGALFMTNINSPTVGFLTQAPGFGVCSPNAVGQDGTLHLKECKVALMRRYEYWATQQPRYFYYFTAPQLFPGFADCLPEGSIIGSERGGNACMQQLLDALWDNYPVAMKNNIVIVFDLGNRLRR
jgi:hypothetical protein